MQRFFKQFSFPGGIGSHCTPETPARSTKVASLGYSVSHAYGAAFRQPGPDRAVWSATANRKPARWPPLAHQQVPQPDHATAPCCRSCTSTATRSTTRRSWPASAHENWKPVRRLRLDAVLRGRLRPDSMHQAMAATLEQCVRRSAGSSRRQRSGKAYPAALADDRVAQPKGWTGPARGGRPQPGRFWRSHQVPMADVKTNPAHLNYSKSWMRSYRPEELFDENGPARSRS